MATCTFTPNPLAVPSGGSATVTVTITKKVSRLEASQGAINVRLVDSDFLADDLLDSKSVSIPPGTAVGATVTVTTTFTLSCKDGEIVGEAGGSGESAAELSIEFSPGGDNCGSCPASCT